MPDKAHVMTFNRFPACSAGKLSNVVREMVTSTALSAASGVKRRQVLVMDEVDGMSGERPGAQRASRMMLPIVSVETRSVGAASVVCVLSVLTGGLV